MPKPASRKRMTEATNLIRKRVESAFFARCQLSAPLINSFNSLFGIYNLRILIVVSFDCAVMSCCCRFCICILTCWHLSRLIETFLLAFI